MDLRRLRELGPLLPLRIALFTILIAAATRTYADPDLWGHVLFGRDIVRQGGVHQADPYSFTSDRAWVNHEWLSEVVMYGAYAAAGARGLVLLRVLVVGLIAVLAVLHLRRLRSDAVMHDASLALVLLGAYGQTSMVRPQLFSLLFFCLLLFVLMASPRQPRWLWAVPCLIGVWVNLHGGWLVGCATAGSWVLGMTIAGRHDRRYLITAAGAGILSAIALLANPYGLRLLSFMFETVGFSRPDIIEWLPVYRLGAGVMVLWLLPIAFVVFVLVRAHRCGSLPRLLVLGMLGVMSFRVARLVGFLAIASVILLRDELAAIALERSARPIPRSGQPMWPWLVAAVIGSVAIAKGVQNSQCIELSSASDPEPSAVQFIRDQGLAGNAITYFNWGEYAIWHLHPEVRVSIDGRRETVYSDAILALHDSISRGEQPGLQFVDKLRPDFIWLPRELPGVDALQRNGWRVAFAGPTSVILVTGIESARPPFIVQRSDKAENATRCFPQP